MNWVDRLRAGRANPGVLDKVAVDYYGTPTPVNQIAAVAVAEARILTITPWDGKMVKAISKAIQTSDIGINPIDDGHTIRLVFPAPTEERRKQLAKDSAEAGRGSQDCRPQCPPRCHGQVQGHEKVRGELTEDDQKNLEEETQKMTDKFVKKIDSICEDKNKEIMEV